MPGKKPFYYKKGRTEIHCDNDNKAAIRLAYLNIILCWVRYFLITAMVMHKMFSR